MECLGAHAPRGIRYFAHESFVSFIHSSFIHSVNTCFSESGEFQLLKVVLYYRLFALL